MKFKKRRFILRWLIPGLLLLVATAYWQRAVIVNFALSRVEIPGGAKVGSFDIKPGKGVAVHDAQFLRGEDGSSGVKAPEIRVEGEIRDIFQGKIDKLIIDSPQVNLSGEELSRLFFGQKEVPKIQHQQVGGTPANVWSAKVWEIRNGNYTLRGKGGEKLTFQANLSGKNASLGAQGFQVDDLSVDIANVELHTAEAKVIALEGMHVEGGSVRPSWFRAKSVESAATDARVDETTWKALLAVLPQFPKSTVKTEPFKVEIQRLKVGKTTLKGAQGAWGATFSAACGPVSWKGDEGPDIGNGRFDLQGVFFRKKDFADLRVDGLKLTVAKLNRRKVDVTALEVKKISVDLGLEATAFLEAPHKSSGGGGFVAPGIALAAASCDDFFLRLPPSTMFRPDSAIPCGELRGKMDAAGLSWDGKELKGEHAIHLELSDMILDYPRWDACSLATASLAAGGGGALSAVTACVDAIPLSPLLRCEKMEAQVAPSETKGSVKWVRKLEITRPVLSVNALSLPRTKPSSTGGLPFYIGWVPKQAAILEGKLFFATSALATPPVSADFNLVTNDTEQVLSLGGIIAHAPVTRTQDPVPLASVGLVELAWNPATVWVDKALNRLDVKNLHVQVGQPLYDRFQAFPHAPSRVEQPVLEPNIPEAPFRYNWKKSPLLLRLRQWRLLRLSLAESTVTVTDLLPGTEGSLLPRLTLPVDFVESDVPLTLEGLAASEQLRPVTLRNLEVTSPYFPDIPVLALPKITISFSLSGLLKQRIESVDLKEPVLYVGQDLFWYQEYFRKVTRTEVAPVGKGEGDSGWSVGWIGTESGKMIIALKGVPLKAFQLPFPFHFSYEFTGNKLNFASEIPERNYEFPKQEVALLGVKGNLQFNLPLPTESNNLVNTVYIREARWKKFKVTEAWASVTYAKESVSGSFGAVAYGGYVTGGFFMKLDKDYTWTAWLSGTDMETRGITAAVAPEYLDMDTLVNGNMTASGTSQELSETVGKLKVMRPGSMKISRIEDIVKKLPTDWSSLQRESLKVTMTPLENYHFEGGEVSFQTQGREGDVKLDLHGNEGRREILMKLHDYRGKAR